MNYYYKWESPLGSMHIVCDDTSLKVLAFNDNWPILQKKYQKNLETKKTRIHELVVQQLSEYVTKKRKNFDIPMDPDGTEFQKTVWRALLTIPYGQVRTYQEQAESINNPKAIRAVGTANGKNPISILIPCHRVIGKDGKLRGYAGGLDSKDNLLKLEDYL